MDKDDDYGKDCNTAESFEGFLKRTLGEDYSSQVIEALEFQRRFRKALRFLFSGI